MKWSLVLISIAILACGGLADRARADESFRPVNPGGEATVPWDQFSNLLNLDKDRIVISLETFQKLLAQTGVKPTGAQIISGGNVVLTRAEFDSLVRQMKPPVEITDCRPVDFLITKAIYSGKMKTGSTVFTGEFTVHVLKKDAYVEVPLLPVVIALEDITVDGKQALVTTDAAFHRVVLDKDGEHKVVVRFSVKSSLDKGPNKFDLSIIPTPIRLLTLEMPLADIDVEIPQAQQVLTTTKGDLTIVNAAIASDGIVSVRWRKKVAPTEKVPAKLYTELYHLLSIEDGSLSITTDINLNILYSEIDGIRVAIPRDLRVLSVAGEGVGEWQEKELNGVSTILVPFTYDKKGNTTITIRSELSTTESGMANVFSGMRVLESERETGFLGIVLNTSAEVTVAENKGLEQVAASKLPPQIVNKSSKPLTVGFKYLKHPYSLVLDIKKHDKIPVPVAAINSANVVTLFTEDGKIVHRLVYQVVNSDKQFLEVQIPDGSDLWSVFVDNQPVESSVNDSGTLMVPLIRSRMNGSTLESFPVEILYCVVENNFDWYGSRTSTLPVVDLLISRVMWSVYLPNDYSYHHFESTLEIEEMIRGINILSNRKRVFDSEVVSYLTELGEVEPSALPADELKKAYNEGNFRSEFRNIPQQEEQLKYQVTQEFDFSNRLSSYARGVAGGILPIQIQVPTGGQVYRFARTFIKPGDPLSVEVVYSRDWMAGVVKWLLIALAALLLWINRRQIVKPLRAIKKWTTKAIEVYKTRASVIRKVAQSPITPFALIGLGLVVWPLSYSLAMVCFLGFWLSVGFIALDYRNKRRQQQAMERASRLGQQPTPPPL
ncbi:MAG: hypothetical protein AB1483_07475 [Candidatus Zixiibacteriota bacterium]